MEATFKNVGGMRCQGCVDKLEKFIGSIDGVERVQVDLSAKSVQVDFSAPATQEQISEAILDAGFEL
ncbi:copper ion binding protein [uncultured Helicobacter sp.]|uniref:copper ion binding protein n=1 Tax=uncultured Helicobacter sp. TaxID=175537 RepID=UPI00374F7172